MSIALDTLVLFIFILVPGITFRRFYFRGNFSQQFNSKSIAHSMTASILPGLIIQLITIFTYNSFASVDSEKIENFYSKLADNSLPSNILNIDILTSISAYIVLMLIISWIFSLIAWNFVRLFKFDQSSAILRFTNHWNYFFKGEISGIKEFQGVIVGKVLEVRADILVRIENEEPRLYTGILNQHTLNPKTLELDCVYLTEVSIYKKDDISNTRKKKRIPGDVMIVSARDIININLNYVTLPKKPSLSPNGPILFSLWLASVFFIFFTNYYYLNSNTVFKTLLIKLFFILYFSIFFAFSYTLFKKNKSTTDKEGIKGLIIILFLMTVGYYVLRFVIF